jgi:hypothetical protein
MELPAAAGEAVQAAELYTHRRTALRVASLVAGGLAAPLVCAPLDVLRTRMQGERPRAPAAARSRAWAPWC